MLWWLFLIYGSIALKMLLILVAIVCAVGAVITLIVGIDPYYRRYLWLMIPFVLGCFLFILLASITLTDVETAKWINYSHTLDPQHPLYTRIQHYLDAE